MPPLAWHDFLNEVSRLFYLIQPHWSYQAALRMNNRSVRKMATVARMDGDGPFIQVGLIQRGLGFGWRLNDLGYDLDELRHYFRVMPVSIGAAFLTCDPDVVMRRNRKRLLNPETRHENRSFQVPLMMPAIAIAKEELGKRTQVVEIDVEKQSPDHARDQLIAFSRREDDALIEYDPHETILSQPPWWV